MTNKRSNLMEKLRQKFKWSSRRYPPDNTELVKSVEEQDRDISVFITMGSDPLWEEIDGPNPKEAKSISIKLVEVDKTKTNPYPREIEAYITFEEFDILYRIAKEKQYEAIVKHVVPEEVEND